MRHFSKEGTELFSKHMKRCLVALTIRELDVKSASGMAVITEADSNKCWGRCGCWLVEPAVVNQGIQEVNIEVHVTSSSTPRHIPKRNEDGYQHNSLNMNVHSSIIHSSLKLQIAHMPIHQ